MKLKEAPLAANKPYVIQVQALEKVKSLWKSNQKEVKK